MKVNQWRLRHQWDLESHEAWLAEQARKGLHYKRRIGAWEQFETGMPGEFSFCWDRPPRFGKEAKAVYGQWRIGAGWRAVTESGGLVCWRRPVEPGAPVRPPRDVRETQSMLKRLVTDNLLSGAILTYVILRSYYAVTTKQSSVEFLYQAVLVLAPVALAFLGYNLFRLKQRL